MRRRTLVMVIGFGLLLLGYITLFTPLSTTTVLGNSIEKISIEDMATTKVIEITDDEEIEELLKDLKINQWNKKLIWNLKLAPNIYLNIDGQIIGLFENENFAKIEGGANNGYYNIPDGVCDNIVKYIRGGY